MKDDDAKVVSKYAKASEHLYQSIKDPGYLLARPLIDFRLTPLYYYRVGILLSALEAGYHDVLEFGAGTCWLGSILYRLGSRVTFLEVSHTALRLGRKLVKTLEPVNKFSSPPEFIVYDGITFPMQNECMDRILCHDALHHVSNPRKILEEMYRVLRPGGRLALAEPGEGHSRLEASQKDMNKYGVIEADVDFETLASMAKEIGFSNVLVKLFPKIETMTVYEEEYLAFQQGENDILPHDKMREDLKYFQVVALTKAPLIIDTRYPHDLRAEIKLKKQPSHLSPGSSRKWEIRFTNIGNTTWLSPISKSPDGEKQVMDGCGHVWINLQLNDQSRAAINPKYLRIPLEKNISSGEKIDVSLDIPIPVETGNYVFEFDLLSQGHFLFSDVHLNPHISESLKIPMEV